MQYELEYENLLYVTRGQGGQHITAGFGRTSGIQNGVMTSAQVKRIGCDAFKTLVEENKLLINDVDVISEISTFIQVKNSYAADEGYYDDLVMTLVLFGWVTSSAYFKDLTSPDFRRKIFNARMEDISNSLTPYMGYDDGQNTSSKLLTDSAGNDWYYDNMQEKMKEIAWLLE